MNPECRLVSRKFLLGSDLTVWLSFLTISDTMVMAEFGHGLHKW